MKLFDIKQHYIDRLKDRRLAESLFFWVAENLLKQSKIQLILAKDDEIGTIKEKNFFEALKELENDRPIQYILQSTNFCGMDLFVDERVLIPRPETEELVEWILENNNGQLGRVLDIGTGSGCIPLALKKKVPSAELFGLDISEGALQVAQKNSEKLQLAVEWIKGDICADFQWSSKPLDIIVSNPPYIPNSEKKLMSANVLNYEPPLALFVENSEPLLFYDKIASFALMYLKKKGQLFFELNEFNAEKVKALLQQKGFSNVHIQTDLEGKQRMLLAFVA